MYVHRAPSFPEPGRFPPVPIRSPQIQPGFFRSNTTSVEPSRFLASQRVFLGYRPFSREAARFHRRTAATGPDELLTTAQLDELLAILDQVRSSSEVA